MKEGTKIAVVGLGYVGLPLALRFAEVGCVVTGLDVDASKVEKLNRGESYIRHISTDRISALIRDGHFLAGTDFELLRGVSVIVICVPTPLNKNREPDLSFVLDTGRAISPHLQKGHLVILESTTYPGTTEQDLRRVLEANSPWRAGVDFHLAYSPEREDPGNPESEIGKIPKVVGGLTRDCLAKAVEFYGLAVENLVPVSSCRVAEATKLMENIFRSVNIALVNELKVIYDAMDIDVWEVIQAAKSKPFGFMAFYPGPGLGGHCIPIDPFYLTWKAREFGQDTRFIELAGQINTSMPDYVISRVADVLNAHEKSIKGTRILLLGLAYKANVDDDRESPSYVLMEKLEQKGARVSYNDPFIPVVRPSREHANLAGRKSVEISDEYDLILLVTPHDIYSQYDFTEFQAPLVDTRAVVRRRPRAYYRA
jgi:UDP-N-acetyl-D-glucosamine dehydrogenase